MLIYNRPYIILVATGDRAYVNLHPKAYVYNIAVIIFRDIILCFESGVGS